MALPVSDPRRLLIATKKKKKKKNSDTWEWPTAKAPTGHDSAYMMVPP